MISETEHKNSVSSMHVYGNLFFFLLLYLYLVLLDVSITLHSLVDRHQRPRGTWYLARIEEALLT